MISLLMVPSACRVMLSLGLISQPSLYLRHTKSQTDSCKTQGLSLASYLMRDIIILPHNFSIVCRDMAQQHHRVQLHAALLELLLWDWTELHRWTWINRSREGWMSTAGTQKYKSMKTDPKTFYLQHPHWIWWPLLKFHMCKLQRETHQPTESQPSSCSHLIGCWGHRSPGVPRRLWTRILCQRGGRPHSRVQWGHQWTPSYYCLSLTPEWILPPQLKRNKHKKINSKEVHPSHDQFNRNNWFLHLRLTLSTAESRTPLAMNVTSAASSVVLVSRITNECFVWDCRIEYRPPCCSWALFRNQVPTIVVDNSIEKWASSPSSTSQPLRELWIFGPGTN